MAAESLVVAMKEPLGRGIRNQINRSRHSLFVGSLEDENDSLARQGSLFLIIRVETYL